MRAPEFDDPEVLRAILESLQTGVYLVDRERRIVLWNAGAERITGYLRQDVLGRFCREDILVHCDEKNNIVCGSACPLTGTMRDGQPREAMFYLRHRAGYRIPVVVRAVPIRDRRGVIIGAAESFDVQRFAATDRRQGLGHASHIDALTGVFTFEFTQAQLREQVISFAEKPVPFGLLCIQVDHLDQLKAARGAEACAAILSVVAQTLRNSLRGTDVVGRWGPAQFLAIVANCTRVDMQRVAERLANVVSCSSIPWWGDQLSATVSMGGTIVKIGDSTEAMLERVANALAESLKKVGAITLVE
ncbi:MAG TPA: diguanylate cyclase [Terriglobales bacterium]|nr:diguanylate cyclase [Terriglobales bacterium]